MIELAVKFDYLKCPLHRYTFSVKTIREWVEQHCEGKVLNLFARHTKLNVDEIRNDISEEANAEYCMDALKMVVNWKGNLFQTIGKIKALIYVLYL